MNMKKLATLFLFSTLYFSSNAQERGQALIDSLLPLLPFANDTNGIINYHHLALAYVPIDPEKASAYGDTGMNLAKKLDWKKGIASFHILRGNILNDAGEGAEAIVAYRQGLAISERLNDKNGIAKAMNDIGGVHFRASNYTDAIAWFTNSLQIAETTGDNNHIGTALTNISSVYYNQQDFEKSVEYNRKALPYFEKLGDPDKIARTQNYLGNSFFAMGRKKEAETAYNEALQIYTRTNNRTGVAILLSQIAILFDPDYEKIISYQLKSQAIWDSINPKHYNSIINLGNLGETYMNFVRADSNNRLNPALRKNYLDKAAFYLEKTIRYSRETNDIDNLSYFTQVLADQQALKGDYRSALENYKRGYGLRDSLYSQENKNKIAGIESKREIEIRDKQLEINRLELATQRKLRIAMIAGIALLLLIGFLIFRQSMIRKRTNTTLLHLNGELDEANKIKARFFAILSHDLRAPVANLISFLELQQQQPGLMSPEESGVHQSRIAAAAKSLLETMETILLWSKGQMETFKPQIRAVPVSALFDHVKGFFSGITNIQMKFDDPGQMVIDTDENYLQTIMHNLTANAVKVLKDRPNGIIEWKAFQKDGKTILSIKDNGPGVNDDQVKMLYEETAVPNSRSGFGLHLVRDLAKAIKCQISMSSAPDTGTTFRLIH
jgi:signal transduction histidine kinase/predicted negative regulator of RcsB-dependent stress response